MNLDQRTHDTALESYNKRSKKKKKQASIGFNNLGIAPNLIKGVNRLNFDCPTPIQKKSIPVGIQGNDIIAIAQTGSGKTLAFGIPMLQRLSEMKKGGGLILVPTRELAIQVDESLQAISRSVNIYTVVLIGGASINLQLKALKRKPRIIIATPGRLLDHIERGTVNLAQTEVFVLDEADRMLDMGFIPDIKKIMKTIPDKSQTMLFSATMPKEIEAIAEKLMEEPTHIEIDRSGATPAEITHEMFVIKNHDKKRLLAVQLKQCSGPVLVFTRTKRMATKLTTKVNNMGFTAAEIHSDRSQGQRQRALEGFKQGKFQVLIATDIAARGIDVSGIELVVNYDMPANSEDYVHRIGRTGRAGKRGHAISFATTAQEGSIKHIERFMKTKLAISTLPPMPSEKSLIKEGKKFSFKEEFSKDKKSSKRKSSKDRPVKHKEVSQFNFEDEILKEQKPSKKKSAKERSAKRKDSKKSDANESPVKALESTQEVLKGKDKKRWKPKRKASRSKNSKSGDNKNSFWSNFKKNRPARKKSAAGGSKRKKRTKSK